jgi:hypothetical protein
VFKAMAWHNLDLEQGFPAVIVFWLPKLPIGEDNFGIGCHFHWEILVAPCSATVIALQPTRQRCGAANLAVKMATNTDADDVIRRKGTTS